jgi:hypothetical protein
MAAHSGTNEPPVVSHIAREYAPVDTSPIAGSAGAHVVVDAPG